MPKNETYYVKIGGIYCDHCRHTITACLRALPGVTGVTVTGSVARVTASRDVRAAVVAAVTRAGYVTKQAWICTRFNRWLLLQWLTVTAELGGLLLLWWLLRRGLGYDVFNFIPVIDSGVSLFAVFAAGLLTSLHCVGMCGAINLVASRSGKDALLYNLGRVGCYTAVGFLVGLLGQTVSFSPRAQGVFTVCVAAAMLLMGLSMAGLIPLPRFSCHLNPLRKTGSALWMGVLNGFVPCGPLSAMQLYALSTASPWRGALSLLLFGLGTVPLMLGFGTLQNLFQKRRALLQQLMALFIVLLASSMLLRGMSSLGVNLRTEAPADNAGYALAELSGDTQVVRVTADYGSYGDIKVKAGVPVVFIIDVPAGHLTGCNREVVCTALGFNQTLTEGENTIRFTPELPGLYTYSCWMYMINNEILVYE